MYKINQHLWCVDLLLPQSKSPGSNPCSSGVLHGVFSVYSSFLPQSKNMQIIVRLIGDSKLIEGVNVILNGCLSLYDDAVIHWQPVLGEHSKISPHYYPWQSYSIDLPVVSALCCCSIVFCWGSISSK